MDDLHSLSNKSIIATLVVSLIILAVIIFVVLFFNNWGGLSSMMRDHVDDHEDDPPAGGNNDGNKLSFDGQVKNQLKKMSENAQEIGLEDRSIEIAASDLGEAKRSKKQVRIEAESSTQDTSETSDTAESSGRDDVQRKDRKDKKEVEIKVKVDKREERDRETSESPEISGETSGDSTTSSSSDRKSSLPLEAIKPYSGKVMPKKLEKEASLDSALNPASISSDFSSQTEKTSINLSSRRGRFSRK